MTATVDIVSVDKNQLFRRISAAGILVDVEGAQARITELQADEKRLVKELDHLVGLDELRARYTLS